MKLKSVAGVTYFVQNLKKTAAFYESLGFLADKHEPDLISVRLNWFWIEFREGRTCDTKECGMFLAINVEDVDECYHGVLEKGYKPMSEPQDGGGKREFVLHDPDGYPLVFFSKK